MGERAAESDQGCCAHPKCPGGSLCCCQQMAETAQQQVVTVLALHQPEPCAYIARDGTRFWWVCDADYCDWASDETPKRDDAAHAAQHHEHVAALILDRLNYPSEHQADR